ncbi:hypothetical protein LEMLEM_LOCUS21242 [Lemmus lemmus]
MREHMLCACTPSPFQGALRGRRHFRLIAGKPWTLLLRMTLASHPGHKRSSG